MNYADIFPRAIAAIIDSLILSAVNFAIASVFGTTTAAGGQAAYALQGPAAGLTSLIGIGYYVLLEGLRGATVGKMAMGLTVLKEDGAPCDLVSALIRTLLKIVDFLPCFYIVGMVLISNSEKKQRFGDRVAQTVVVKK
jgi:uncharacterized RDD family membrane protein YckC